VNISVVASLLNATIEENIETVSAALDDLDHNGSLADLGVASSTGSGSVTGDVMLPSAARRPAQGPPFLFQIDSSSDDDAEPSVEGGANSIGSRAWYVAIFEVLVQRGFAFIALFTLLLTAFAGVSFLQSSHDFRSWWPCQKRQLRDSVRQHAEAMKVTHSSDIVSTFGEEDAVQAGSPGMCVRIQGKIVATPQSVMSAPFSGRSCVMYSASVAHGRLDGVHQPPVAYHSANSDFVVELADDPEVKVTVHGQDVALFDMVQGSCAQEYMFVDAPEAWQAFTLAHTVGRTSSDAPCGASSQVDFGVASARELEFCESALPVGATVTCLGEVVRDRLGGLNLLPWRPARGAAKRPDDVFSLPNAVGRRLEEHMDSLVGRVMVSDDPMLVAFKTW
jgi:hypothetical protein